MNWRSKQLVTFEFFLSLLLTNLNYFSELNNRVWRAIKRLIHIHIHKVTNIDHMNAYQESESLPAASCKHHFIYHPIYNSIFNSRCAFKMRTAKGLEILAFLVVSCGQENRLQLPKLLLVYCKSPTFFRYYFGKAIYLPLHFPIISFCTVLECIP